MGRKNSNLSFIIKKLDEIKKSLETARSLLDSADKSEFDPMNNVRFIVPQIDVEYEEFKKGDEKSVAKLLEKYQIWSHEVCASILANQGSLKNKKLRTHLSKSLQTCESLDYSFRSVFNVSK